MAKVAAAIPALSQAAPIIGLASTALSGLGALSRMREEEDAFRDRDRALARVDQEEQARQAQLREQQNAALDQLVQQHQAQTQAPAIEAEARAQVERLAPPPETFSAQSALPSGAQLNASNIVREDAARQMSSAAEETRKRLAALASLSAFGTVGENLARDRAASAADTSITQGLRAGGLSSARDRRGVANTVLQSFQPSPLSSIMSGVGQLGSAAAGYLSTRGPFDPVDPEPIRSSTTTRPPKFTNLPGL